MMARGTDGGRGRRQGGAGLAAEAVTTHHLNRNRRPTLLPTHPTPRAAGNPTTTTTTEQDIPKTNDRAPSRTFYTWRVDLGATAALIAAELYRAANNARMRLAHEVASHSDVDEILTQLAATGQLSHGLTERQRAEARYLRAAGERLEASLLQLDDMIALFNDF